MLVGFAGRAAATEATLARYRTKPFDWSKRATCIHLAHTQARNMGHDVPTVPTFSTALGARRALKARGHDTLEALMDSMFPRIAPARMLVGDLALLPADDGWGSICVFDGLAKLLGWHGSDPSGIKPIARAQGDIVAAWGLGTPHV